MIYHDKLKATIKSLKQHTNSQLGPHVYIVGGTGVGKSEIGEIIAQTNEIRYTNIYKATLEPIISQLVNPVTRSTINAMFKHIYENFGYDFTLLSILNLDLGMNRGVLESIRNPKEIEIIREKNKDSLFIGITCSDMEERKRRIKDRRRDLDIELGDDKISQMLDEDEDIFQVNGGLALCDHTYDNIQSLEERNRWAENVKLS